MPPAAFHSGSGSRELIVSSVWPIDSYVRILWHERNHFVWQTFERVGN